MPAVHWFHPSTILAALPFLTASALAPAQTPEQPVAHGISVSNMDPAVKPGDDFYLYANGAWIARTRIPADRASVSVFTALLDKSRKNVAAIVQRAAQANAPEGSNE